MGVCDNEPLMAKQLFERFRVKEYFTNLRALLEVASPDIVHVTTPPDSHFEIARYCLERGCHVYVEKPFTVNAKQAEILVDMATTNGLKITAGHNHQFSNASRRMRALVMSGYLGGPPVHMESHYCYDLSDPTYARALLGDKEHWVRKLPGRLLHNIISHGVARIAEYLTDDDPHVVAYGLVSPRFRDLGETDIVDEVRVIISDRKLTTAYFTFSSQMRPVLHEFRIYGPRNGVLLDCSHEVVLQLRGTKYKSYADHFIAPVDLARQYVSNVITNAKAFVASDFSIDSGMRFLIRSFYNAIRQNSELPISYREIVLTARIMDRIFEQCLPTTNVAFSADVFAPTFGSR